MTKGTLVRLIEQTDEDGWLSTVSLDKRKRVGVIIDSKIENNWISGHGPMDFEVCLVSWCDGTVKWVDTASLTSYGL
jgi:hypothetical protein